MLDVAKVINIPFNVKYARDRQKAADKDEKQSAEKIRYFHLFLRLQPPGKHRRAVSNQQNPRRPDKKPQDVPAFHTLSRSAVLVGPVINEPFPVSDRRDYAEQSNRREKYKIQYLHLHHRRHTAHWWHTELVFLSLAVSAHNAELLHHLLHFLKLTQETVHVRNGISAACRDAPFPFGVDY